MPLQFEIISDHRDLVADDAVHEFGEDGGTIGRALDNDWILPDPDKYISGRHATIDHRGGMWYLADLSTNGVFFNGEREPVGRGNPRRIFDGDHIRMGDFEMVVAIDQGESVAMPLEGERTEYPEPIDLPVEDARLVTGVELLDEDALVGSNVSFDDLVFDTHGDDGITESLSVPERADDSALEKALANDAEPSASMTGATEQTAGVTADDLFDTFLDGMGMSRADLHPDTSLAEVMQNAGEVLKEFVEGMSQLLDSRAQVKAAFRLDQTTTLPRHNNPLKLAETPADSLLQLLVGREDEYLGPRNAVHEACRDLLQHQEACLSAMGTAFAEFADRLDPQELEAAFAARSSSLPLPGFIAKGRYWEYYRDLYFVLANRGDDAFPQTFVDEFVNEYERLIADFKRTDATRILERSHGHSADSTAPLRAVHDCRDTPANDDESLAAGEPGGKLPRAAEKS